MEASGIPSLPNVMEVKRLTGVPHFVPISMNRCLPGEKVGHRHGLLGLQESWKPSGLGKDMVIPGPRQMRRLGQQGRGH